MKTPNTNEQVLDPVAQENSEADAPIAKKKIVLHKETLRHLRARTQIRAGEGIGRSERNFDSCG